MSHRGNAMQGPFLRRWTDDWKSKACCKSSGTEGNVCAWGVFNREAGADGWYSRFDFESAVWNPLHAEV